MSATIHRIQFTVTATFAVELDGREASKLAHKLRDTAQDQLLDLLEAHCPKPFGRLEVGTIGGKPTIEPL